MQRYQAPLADFAFNLERMLDYEHTIAALPGFEEASLETARAVIAQAAEFGQEVLLPLNPVGDAEGCRFEDGAVTTPSGFP